MSIAMETSQEYAEQEFVVRQLKNYRDEAIAHVEKCTKKLEEFLYEVSESSANGIVTSAFVEMQNKCKISRDYVTSLEQTIFWELLKLAQLKGESNDQ